MPSECHRSVLRPLALIGAVGALLLAAPFGGCAGSLDPSQFPGGGGNSTGGTSGGGTGGASNCTGGSSGDQIITNSCVNNQCHNPQEDSTLGAGLDLTINSTIASRLVDVVSPGDTAGQSVCGGNPEPYLKGGSNPATGLLIDKIQTNPTCPNNANCCGVEMPQIGNALSASQVQCVIEWATTLTMASQ